MLSSQETNPRNDKFHKTVYYCTERKKKKSSDNFKKMKFCNNFEGTCILLHHFS